LHREWLLSNRCAGFSDHCAQGGDHGGQDCHLRAADRCDALQGFTETLYTFVVGGAALAGVASVVATGWARRARAAPKAQTVNAA
jgi:hypothetical protein